MDIDSPLERARTYGGIIKKKDISFIKNLKKSKQKIKKKYKLKKVNKSKRKMKPKNRTKKNTKVSFKNRANKNTKAGFNNRGRRSIRKSSFRPFIIKNLNTRRYKKSSKKTKKCS